MLSMGGKSLNTGLTTDFALSNAILKCRVTTAELEI